ncbi:MAG: Flp pilus assembly protein CpaB [Alphaproteobacteria bacterium]|jgi:pilus assembly protein CpaB|nr:Flp pilus assembly protein CpaB [Alphaproteobacteria bacterium]MDP6622071.1 Flp pilus assembly protein CpaB [Alphaproteobacteria bacterium]
MRLVTIVIIVVALAVSGVTAFMIQHFLAAQTPKVQEKQEKVPAERVLVAKVDLPAGKLLNEKDHFRWQAWPRKNVQPQFIMRGSGAEKEMIGAAVKRGIDAGEPITAARVIKPTDKSFMAAVLKPGMRAVSIAISGPRAVAGFVSPGDRVDLILTLTVKSKEIEALWFSEDVDTDNRERERVFKGRVSEVILRDLRVLAVDQQTRELGTKTKKPSSISFEVSLKQATVIATARSMGKLSLALRSHTPGPSEEPRKQFMLTDDMFTFTSELEFLSVMRGGLQAHLDRLSELRSVEFPELRDQEELEPEAPLPPPEVDKTAEMALNRANQALQRAEEAFQRADRGAQPTPTVKPKASPAPVIVAADESVLVAKVDLPAGKILNEEEDFLWQTWPTEDLQPQFIVRGTGSEKELISAAVKRSIEAGEPITAARVIKRTDKGFLAAALKPGMRAVSVDITGALAVAGFVSPGDRVDLILTMTVKIDKEDVPEGFDTKNQKVSEVILRDLRVLAVDQSTQEVGAKSESGKTMTFEVSLKQATVIATARGMGGLSLALRSHMPGSSEEPPKQFLLTDDMFTFTSELEFMSVLRGGLLDQFGRLGDSKTPDKRAGRGAQPTPLIEPLDAEPAKPPKPVVAAKKRPVKAAAKPPTAPPKAPPPKKPTKTEKVTIDRAGKTQTLKFKVAE